MTPLARVEAAILKLETLKRDSTPGPWVGWKAWNPLYGERVGVAGSSVVVSREGELSLVDADLMCTLRSTVDPMLAILRDTLDLFRDPIPIFKGREEQVFAAQLELADAILGAS